MKSVKSFSQVLLIILLFPIMGSAQDYSKFYINAGYITNFQKCEECVKADAGGSVRLGYLSKKRLGFYAGYLWFNEYHKDYIGYDDKGNAFLAGIDLLIVRQNKMQLYAQLGIENEKFISTYPNRTESETNIKPDLGLLINCNHINGFIGWQPSEPHHINLGLGITLFNKKFEQ